MVDVALRPRQNHPVAWCLGDMSIKLLIIYELQLMFDIPRVGATDEPYKVYQY